MWPALQGPFSLSSKPRTSGKSFRVQCTASPFHPGQLLLLSLFWSRVPECHSHEASIGPWSYRSGSTITSELILKVKFDGHWAQDFNFLIFLSPPPCPPLFFFSGPCTCLTSILPLSCTRNQNAFFRHLAHRVHNRCHYKTPLYDITESLLASHVKSNKHLHTRCDVFLLCEVGAPQVADHLSGECRTPGGPEFLPEPSPARPLPTLSPKERPGQHSYGTLPSRMIEIEY